MPKAPFNPNDAQEQPTEVPAEQMSDDQLIDELSKLTT